MEGFNRSVATVPVVNSCMYGAFIVKSMQPPSCSCALQPVF